MSEVGESLPRFPFLSGLVHLEALETVSNQCEGRVQNMVMVLGPGELSTVKHELIIIKEIFQIEEQSDEEESDEQKGRIALGSLEWV